LVRVDLFEAEDNFFPMGILRGARIDPFWRVWCEKIFEK
jgi:hypothetical protein